ncbi:hypothetical protein B0T10DRAFT_485596 [Thelonectria olida]|uniref:Cytoplasmic tRNA 2-thiolation protein 2 n=1 Tax=Thelonectria olida TaxID=1576542 RepID=A0A9P8W4A6_9HYPO|nr:hypothetical protein B0T10DRAFT_485596 [Thelonectria olida]
MPGSDTSQPCKRCKAEDAPFRLRADPTCRDCYVQYIALKLTKRLNKLHSETRVSRQLATRRYLAGLSFGPSSSVLCELLDSTARRHSQRKGSSPFSPLVVHVDTDLSAGENSPARRLVDDYRSRFPHVEFECVPLTEALDVKSIDWSSLPLSSEDASPAVRLQRLFDALPTVTSRADVLRQFIRHILLHVALKCSCSALLLGHSTTALAALTLSEVANGRGFAVPWQANDGMCTISTYAPPGESAGDQIKFPVYYPLREVLRNELIRYIDLVPTLKDLVPADQMAAGGSGSVVSHKDLSIEEVMARYFGSVEDSYAGIVANVVRTAGKLDRVAGDEFCGSCGMTLDELGDSRWAGELGDELTEDVPDATGKLCYGCKRSIHG